MKRKGGREVGKAAERWKCGLYTRYVCPLSLHICELPLIIYFTLAYVTYTYTLTHTHADSKTGGNFNVQQKRVTISIIVVVAVVLLGEIVRGYCVHRYPFYINNNYNIALMVGYGGGVNYVNKYIHYT